VDDNEIVCGRIYDLFRTYPAGLLVTLKSLVRSIRVRAHRRTNHARSAVARMPEISPTAIPIVFPWDEPPPEGEPACPAVGDGLPPNGQ
jgi:hypothetical protein